MQGAREIAARSDLARRDKLRGIVVVEPTRMLPVRGHRSHIVYSAVATGVQAHSSTGRGRNANWALLPFMMEMRALYQKLRDDPAVVNPTSLEVQQLAPSANDGARSAARQDSPPNPP